MFNLEIREKRKEKVIILVNEMVQYKLYYFNGRGRAELARYIFAAAGQEYEGKRVSENKQIRESGKEKKNWLLVVFLFVDVRFERDQWPNYKPKSPTGQAPFIEIVDGDKTTALAQSVSIARFLATRFNLAGKGDIEQAEVNM